MCMFSFTKKWKHNILRFSLCSSCFKLRDKFRNKIAFCFLWLLFCFSLDYPCFPVYLDNLWYFLMKTVVQTKYTYIRCMQLKRHSNNSGNYLMITSLWALFYLVTNLCMSHNHSESTGKAVSNGLWNYRIGSHSGDNGGSCASFDVP